MSTFMSRASGMAATISAALLFLPLVLSAQHSPVDSRVAAGAPSGGAAARTEARHETRPESPRAPDSTALRDMVRYLAGDELAGRRTGTRENRDAASYIAESFRRAGLRQLPGSDGYFRSFEYAADIELGRGNAVMLTTPSGERRLERGVDFNPAGFSSSGRAAGDLVFVGYGISAPSSGYDDYAGVDVAGKVVVAMRRSPDGDNPHGTLGSYADLAVKVATAREKKAAAIIFIDQPGDEGDLPATRLNRNFTHGELPAAFLLPSAFSALRDPSGRALAAVRAAIDSTRTPASFAMTGWKADLTTDLAVRRVSVPNVLGIIPGNDPKLKDELIVLGAHFDHLGWGGEGSLHGGKDSAIHHGADDNASGTATMIALAGRLAAEGGNRRTLLFIGFNGEEEGLLGSASLVRDSTFPTSRIAAMINMDMVGRLDSGRLAVEGIGTSPIWDSLVTAVNGGRLTLKLGKQGYGPSDHASFYSKEVPVLFFFTGTHRDYHRPSDTWEKINYDGMARIGGLVADVIRAIDARDQRPVFTKVAESNEGRTTGGFKVYVGTIPDYTYEEKGLRLTGVAAGGPAEKGGLKEGDVIVRFAGKEINNIYDYTHVLGELKPKQTVDVEFMRDGERQTVQLTLGSR